MVGSIPFGSMGAVPRGAVLRATVDSFQTLVFDAGAADLSTKNALNNIKMTLTADSDITLLDIKSDKWLYLFITHSGAARTLAWDGDDISILVGASGETEVVATIHNGTNWLFFSVGVVDLVL